MATASPAVASGSSSLLNSQLQRKAAASKGKGKAKASTKAKGATKKQTKKGGATTQKRAKAKAFDLDYSPSPEPEDALLHPQQAEASDDEEDDRVYCVCQERYDETRMMIACDRCDEWYHLDCIHVNEDDVELIKDFVCPRCQDTSDARTSWKTRCARNGCNKPAVSLSKYCSTWCGTEVAASRLEKVTLEGGPARYWPVVAHVRKPASLVQRASSLKPSPASDAIAYNDKALQSQLVTLANKRLETDAQVASIDARLRFLSLAVRRWEALRLKMAGQPLVPEPVAEMNSKKGKAKRGAKGKAKAAAATDDADASCGFDVRLVWDDADWETWISSNELDREEARPISEVDEQVVCLSIRRQCDRHAGWQRLHEASFQAEKAGQMRKLDRYAAQERTIRLRLDELAEDRERWLKSNAGIAPLKAEGDEEMSKVESTELPDAKVEAIKAEEAAPVDEDAMQEDGVKDPL